MSPRGKEEKPEIIVSKADETVENEEIEVLLDQEKNTIDQDLVSVFFEFADSKANNEADAVKKALAPSGSNKKGMRGFRYVLLLLGAFASGFIYCNRMAFNFTVICQEPTNSTERPDYYLSDHANKALMFAAKAIGMTLGPIPLTFAYRFESRVIVLAYGTLSIITTVLYPLADSIGFWPAFFSRFATGFAFAGQLHWQSELAMRWSNKDETSFFFAVLMSTSQLGPLIAMALGGEMCSSSLGWEATYYILAAFTTVFTIAFCILYSDDVMSNKFCSDEEKKYILEGKVTVAKVKAPVPHFKLLTDKGVMACFFLFTGYYVGMMVYQMYSPTFIRQVLNFSLRETGYFSGIPMLIAIVLKISLGKLLDHGMGLSQTWRFFGPLLVLEGASTVAIFITGYVEDRVIALFFMLVFASIHSFVPVIYGRTLQIIAGQHAHFALNLNIVVAGVVQILLPGGILFMTPDNTREQWSLLFYVVSILCVVTSLVYICYAQPKLADWAKIEETVEEKAVEKIEKKGEKEDSV